MIEKIESLIKRIRWKAHFFLNKKDQHIDKKETFGFKTSYYPPQILELEPFEKDLCNLVNLIKFRTNMNSFKNQLNKALRKIRESTSLLVFADKTSSIYEMPLEEYNKLLKENITKTYKHAPSKLETSINFEAKHIASKLALSDRIERLANTPVYITLKDHKENFRASIPCRLIISYKSEIGKISKRILEGINNDLLAKLNINQWRDTSQVIDWFKKLEYKSKSKFIQLDVKEYYPSEETLDKAMSFASNDTTVSLEDIPVIKHSRKTLLFHLEQTWKKKESSSCFDVTMGSYDGVEVCELIGIFRQSVLKDIINKEAMGLYRDDGLILLNKVTSKKSDKLERK